MRLLRLSLLAAALPFLAVAAAQAMPTGGTCIEGSCEDGIGTFRNTVNGVTMRGPFSGGRFAPNGTYEVTDPRHPGQVYRITTDADRNWAYTEIWRTDTQFYAGTLKTIRNPFSEVLVSSYAQGRFEDGPDTVYEGQFEYFSLPPSAEQRQQALATQEMWRMNVGIFMFSGIRTVKSTGTKDYGIFASDTAYPLKPLTFTPADPQRIADIRAQYAAAMENSPGAVRARAQAASAAQSASDDGAGLIGTLFQAAAGGLLASSMGQMTGALSGGMGGMGGMGGINAMNLSQVVGVMTGATSPDQAMATMTQQYMAQGLGAAIGASSPQDFASLAASMASGGTVPSTQGALTAATLSQAQTLMQQNAVASTPPGQTLHVPPTAAPSGTGTQTAAATSTGSRIPAVELMTLPCTNENGSFTGQSKVPKAAADCRAEVIAHRKVQCRSDWMTHPSYTAMKACFQKKGIADLSQWR